MIYSSSAPQAHARHPVWGVRAHEAIRKWPELHAYIVKVMDFLHARHKWKACCKHCSKILSTMKNWIHYFYFFTVEVQSRWAFKYLISWFLITIFRFSRLRISPLNDMKYPSWKIISYFQFVFVFANSSRAVEHETQIWGAARSAAPSARKAASVMQRSSPPCLFEVMAWICRGNMASSKQFFSTEKHKYETVMLPWSYLLKNAPNSLCMKDVKRYGTRCNTAKSINFQSGRAPRSFIVRFSTGIFSHWNSA